MPQNLISEVIPPAVITDVSKKFNEIIVALQPYTHGLSPDQRKELVKMGDKSVSYVVKIKDYMGTNPDYVPRWVSTDEFAKDYVITTQLSPLRALAQTAFEMIDDTIMAAGSDVMAVANAYYNNVQDASHRGEAGAKAVFEDLKSRYPYARKPKTP